MKGGDTIVVTILPSLPQQATATAVPKAGSSNGDATGVSSFTDHLQEALPQGIGADSGTPKQQVAKTQLPVKRPVHGDASKPSADAQTADNATEPNQQAVEKAIHSKPDAAAAALSEQTPAQMLAMAAVVAALPPTTVSAEPAPNAAGQNSAAEATSVVPSLSQTPGISDKTNALAALVASEQEISPTLNETPATSASAPLPLKEQAAGEPAAMPLTVVLASRTVASETSAYSALPKSATQISAPNGSRDVTPAPTTILGASVSTAIAVAGNTTSGAVGSQTQVILATTSVSTESAQNIVVTQSDGAAYGTLPSQHVAAVGNDTYVQFTEGVSQSASGSQPELEVAVQNTGQFGEAHAIPGTEAPHPAQTLQEGLLRSAVLGEANSVRSQKVGGFSEFAGVAPEAAQIAGAKNGLPEDQKALSLHEAVGSVIDPNTLSTEAATKPLSSVTVHENIADMQTTVPSVDAAPPSQSTSGSADSSNSANGSAAQQQWPHAGVTIASLQQSQSNSASSPDISAPSAAGAAQSTLDRVQVAQQVVQHLEAARSMVGRGEITLRLSPPELGTLRIALSSGAQGVTAHLVAETSQVQRALMDEQHRLHAALEAQGLKVHSLEISTGSTGQQNPAPFGGSLQMQYQTSGYSRTNYASVDHGQISSIEPTEVGNDEMSGLSMTPFAGASRLNFLA
ncbi:MAG TPA: flagellar hook-length control protein FliK [Chthonomonas sp.]|jgi:hypothetical protein|uniref:flagellar hook-length control protein FliK n=1 Tax=Chthonomonas sp. TaxID=2282153 RepID=UPI002B4B0216|nr:flagellar hook-length control protein FliK [Chthonomonas sp.]HLH79185.1 flagellar hook-length control protein FliK [Chthonomonas sp.]